MNQERLAAVESKIRKLVPRLRGYKAEDSVVMDFIGYINFSGWSKIDNMVFAPIDLEAVLEALEMGCNDYRYVIDSTGRWCYVNDREVSTAADAWWKYGKSLSEQSEETQEFIADLLEMPK